MIKDLDIGGETESEDENSSILPCFDPSGILNYRMICMACHAGRAKSFLMISQTESPPSAN